VRHGVTWLPPFQEAALLGTLLQPLYGGFGMTIMPPFAFLESPLSWLVFVSRHRATFTRAPSFAFELCTRKLRYTVPHGLDLSCVHAAVMEPGPLRSETRDRFAAAFERFGFRRHAFRR
jgi:acyl-CoA synthetase (AMP-forming)/AMP-acid ligase II